MGLISRVSSRTYRSLWVTSFDLIWNVVSLLCKLLKKKMETESYNTSKTIPFSYYEVIAKFFSKNPNPFAKHVQSIDYLEPLQIDKNGAVSTKILNLKTNRIPTFLMFGNNDLITRCNNFEKKDIKCVSIIEEFYIDLVNHSLRHLSWNNSGRKLLRTHEYAEYKAIFPGQSEKSIINEESIQNKVVGDVNNMNLNSNIGTGNETIKIASDLRDHQCYITKNLYIYSPLSYALAYTAQKFAYKTWSKSEIKSTYDLCYTIANNMYNKDIANEFLKAGQYQPYNSWQNIKDKLIKARQYLYENKDIFHTTTNNQQYDSSSSNSMQLINLNKISEKYQCTKTKVKDTKNAIKDDVKKQIKNPKFQLMVLEKLKRMPK